MSFPPGTEMFQFPGFASPPYVFRWRYPKGVGCPIQISTDQRLLAAPRGFSQRATSFIASWCQGIHRMPLSRSRTQMAVDKTRHLLDPPCTGAIHTNKRLAQTHPCHSKSFILSTHTWDAFGITTDTSPQTLLNVVALDRLTMNPCVEAHLSVRQRDQRHVQKRTRT